MRTDENRDRPGTEATAARTERVFAFVNRREEEIHGAVDWATSRQAAERR